MVAVALKPVEAAWEVGLAAAKHQKSRRSTRGSLASGLALAVGGGLILTGRRKTELA